MGIKSSVSVFTFDLKKRAATKHKLFLERKKKMIARLPGVDFNFLSMNINTINKSLYIHTWKEQHVLY